MEIFPTPVREGSGQELLFNGLLISGSAATTSCGCTEVKYPAWYVGWEGFRLGRVCGHSQMPERGRSTTEQSNLCYEGVVVVGNAHAYFSALDGNDATPGESHASQREVMEVQQISSRYGPEVL